MVDEGDGPSDSFGNSCPGVFVQSEDSVEGALRATWASDSLDEASVVKPFEGCFFPRAM